MELRQVLEKTGLTQKQADVYLALLELGVASVQAISKKADIKRPTAYLIMDELQNLGLVSSVPQKKALYIAESPEALQSKIKKQQELLNRFMPEMLALYNVKADKPEVRLFQGENGVKQVFDMVLKSAKADFFGTIAGVTKVNPEGLKQFQNRLIAKETSVRELFSQSKVNLDYAKTAKQLPNYQIKFAKKGMELLTDCALFDDKVALFFYKTPIMALVIKSKEVSESFKNLYELAWESAEDF